MIKNILTKFNYKHIYTTVSGLLFSIILSTSLLSVLGTSSASALTINGGQDCSSNSVINCGITTTSQLSSLNTADVKALYASSPFNINQDDLNNINNTANTGGQDYTESGSVNINNDVVVGSTIVATNAITAGRSSNKLDISTDKQDGTTFYLRHPSASFATTTIAAFVVMKSGVFQFAILAPCGNPVSATPPPVTVTVQHTCDSLTDQVSSSDPNTVVLGVTYTAKGGAVFKSVTYTIDNTTTNTTTTTSGGATNVTYVFPNYGTQNLSATVYFTLNGATVSDSGTGGDCNKSVIYPAPQPPPNAGYDCTAFSITPTPNSTSSVTVTSTETTTTGATFTQAVYDFGDGVTNDQTSTAIGTSTYTHNYANPGTYEISVTDSFSVNGQNQSVVGNCEGVVTVSPPPSTPMCTIPGLTEYAANSPNCVVAIVPAAKLVNTGPGGVGTFLIILGVAAVVSGGGYYFLGKKRSKDPLDTL
jgi:hypothetical protein